MALVAAAAVRMVPTVMVKMAAIVEVSPVFSVEPIVIMFVIDPVTIVSMPCRIGIIGVARISLFVDTNRYVYLCARGIKG